MDAAAPAGVRKELVNRNPWLALPAEPPFAAQDDAEILRRLSGRLLGEYALRLDLLPQPWTGNVHTAEMFVLALNPGFREADYDDLRDSDYAEQWRLALSFETRTPFYFLDPAFKGTGGFEWWHRRLQDLIKVAGLQSVARKVMCLEHFPYKSTRYQPLGETLPSQQYSFDLLRDAIGRQKEVVMMRSERVWLESVPELRTYPYIRLSNNQNPYFSKRQMTSDQFERLCRALA